MFQLRGISFHVFVEVDAKLNLSEIEWTQNETTQLFIILYQCHHPG